MATLRLWLDPHFLEQTVRLYWFTIEDEYVFLVNLMKPGRWNPSEPWLDPYSIESPRPPGTIYTVMFPRQQIDGVWYEEAWLPSPEGLIRNFTLDSDKEYTLQIMVEALFSISVSPQSGFVGTIFTFSGLLTREGTPIPNEVVNLILEGIGIVGSTTTDVDGQYILQWIADRSGNLSFHAEAPNI